MPDLEKFINSIRQEYSGMRDMPRESLASSVKTLADDLYAKDSHFIFELIQNAEDNNYLDGENPFLYFEVRKIEIEKTKALTLIIKNNEIGFNSKNVRAICQVGRSTKKKILGYVGEKGIGFKSVYRITTCPYIFSNGFQFKLPEYDKETKLGYIVPSWVKTAPKDVSIDKTTILLPLDKNGTDSTSVISALREISPETIIFLKKINQIEVTIDSRASTKRSDLKITKKIILLDKNSQLIEIKSVLKENGENVSIETFTYWVTDIIYDKPIDVCHEKRTGIDSRVVSIAIPLNSKRNKGKLFAYLPVWDETGLPFLINADFLLVSSREGVREDEDWNKWLRNCVAETYVLSILSLLSNSEIPFHSKVSAYASIPTETHYPFLAQIVESIKSLLSDRECVLTYPYKMLVKPASASLCYNNFREFLSQPEKLPTHLTEVVHLVCPEMEIYSVSLKSIGVKILTLQDILKCLDDNGWLRNHDVEWFVRLISYLKTQKFEPSDLRKCKIIPVSSVGSFDLSCDAEQPIYFYYDEINLETLNAVPDWLLNISPIKYLNNDFQEILNTHKNSKELKKYLQEVLGVYDFSKENYCLDVIASLQENANVFTTSLYIDITKWIEQNASDKFDCDDLPVKLSNGQIIKLSEACKLHLVVPESNNKSFGIGWSYIFPKTSDRDHFCILDDSYSAIASKWLLSVGVSLYPPLKPTIYNVYQKLTSKSETGLMDKCKQYAANSRHGDTKVKSFILPSSLVQLPSEAGALKCLAETIIQWLNTLIIEVNAEYYHQFNPRMHQLGLYAAGIYENRGTGTLYSPSTILEQLQQLAWLPTTKGFVKPSQAFLPKPGVKEILGDSVPYFESRLQENVLKLLGIRSDVTVAELLGLLREHTGEDSANTELVERIYEELDIRTERSIGDIFANFRNEKLIFVSRNNKDYNWFNSRECVWEDAAEIFGDEYAYLQKQYPKRKKFFVDRLGVKERIDSESFANLWLKLQKKPLTDLNKQKTLLERIYREIKPIALSADTDKPAWWKSFHIAAKIYSQKEIFCLASDILIPDDRFLQQIFVNTEDVEYVWYPEDGSFSELVNFFRIFDVPLLSNSVTEKLAENFPTVVNESNRYVTESAIKMIASWFKEKKRTDYDKLLIDGTFEKLISLKESSVQNGLIIDFCIETEKWTYNTQQSEYKSYWDRSANVFYYKNNVSKAAVAKALAKPLMRNYKDLSLWIELVLGASNIDRIIQDNWSVPREVNELFNKNKSVSLGNKIVKSSSAGDSTSVNIEGSGLDVKHFKNTVIIDTKVNDAVACESEKGLSLVVDSGEVPEITPKEASTTPPHFALKSKKNESEDDENSDREVLEEKEVHLTTNDDAHFQYSSSLRTSFTQAGSTKLKEEVMRHVENGDDGILANPIRRAGKLANDYLENIKNEPHSESRRKETELRLLEPPNESVRSSLYDWYQGKCQICGETWPKKDGNPYFIAAYLVERQNKRWLDNPGNSICLCAKHFAQWRLAAKNTPIEITKQIKNLKLVNEGGSVKLKLSFELIDKITDINYSERHALALRSLVEVAESERIAFGSEVQLGNNENTFTIKSSSKTQNDLSSLPQIIHLSRSPDIATNDISSISDKRVVRAISEMQPVFNHDKSQLFNKVAEIIIRLINHEEFSKIMIDEGIHVTTIKMAVDYLLPGIKVQQHGFTKFPQFIDHVCKSSGCAFLYFKAPSEFRVFSKIKVIPGYSRYHATLPLSSAQQPVLNQKTRQSQSVSPVPIVPLRATSTNRCKFCNSRPMSGSDVCYSCSF